MRILYIVQYLNLPHEPGGGRVYHFAKHWVRLGHHVTIITSTINNKTNRVPEKYRGKLFIREEIEGIEVVRCATRIPGEVGFASRMSNYLSFAILASIAAIFKVGRPDLVYYSSTPLTVGLPGVLASVRWGVPSVFEVRDLWPESAVIAGLLKNRTVIGMARRFEMYLYTWSQMIVAVTRGIGSGIRAKGIPPEKVVFVPNGVDDLYRNLDEYRAGIDRNGRKFRCIYVGALGKWNGNDTIIEAADHLREDDDLEFVFVGDGPERRTMEKRVDDLGLENVSFLGAMPKNEVMEQIAASDLCMICTWDHPFHRMVLANKIFDYLAAAKPVVAAADGEMADLLSECGAGIAVPPADSRAFADAIKRLKDMEVNDRREVGRKGREHVKRHFMRQDLAAGLGSHLEYLVREWRA